MQLILLISISFPDKKPKPENVDIFTLKATERRLKLIKITLAQLWEQGYIVRINNFSDKERPPHCEKDIKSQVNKPMTIDKNILC